MRAIILIIDSFGIGALPDAVRYDDTGSNTALHICENIAGQKWQLRELSLFRNWGGEHIKTGRPIVYTSADFVFQVAAHEEVIPLKELYRICELSRELVDPYYVARVIARPSLLP